MSIYDLTSIARPIDPSFPTNKAVIIIALLVAALGAIAAWLGWIAETAPQSAALIGSLTAVLAWAVTRELAPDDNPAAFVSLLLAVLIYFAVGSASLWQLIICLFLVRVVNRSTGKPLTAFDVLTVLMLVLLAQDRLAQPLLLLVAAVSFALDGALVEVNRKSRLAAVLCVVGPLAYAGFRGLPPLHLLAPPMIESVLVALILLASVLAIALHKPVVSKGDVGGQTLSTTRVRMGMVVAVLVALQTFVSSDTAGANLDGLIWACLAGMVIGRLIPRPAAAV